MSDGLLKEVREERRRNLEDIIRHAKWEAEMVRKLGKKWFEIRDKWLQEALEADMELWRRNPKIREALIKVIEAKDRVKRSRTVYDPQPSSM